MSQLASVTLRRGGLRFSDAHQNAAVRQRREKLRTSLLVMTQKDRFFSSVVMNILFRNVTVSIEFELLVDSTIANSIETMTLAEVLTFFGLTYNSATLGFSK